MPETSKTILAWHFRRLDGTTSHLRNPETVGEWYRVKGRILPCANGLHASINPLDALKYAGGFLICRFECAGTIVHHEDGDKLACSDRRVLWQADATSVLLLFAADCAERALLREREAGREPDSRSFAAIETVRRYVAGAASKSDLDAARAEAEAAAYAARAEAEAAAYAARAARAAYAAYAAARAARAEEAAYAADAAYTAAYAAARAEEAAWQSSELERRLLALAPAPTESEEASHVA
jgi:hypothetical protein